MGNVLNVKIEPCTVKYGEDVSQIESITCSADVAGSLNNKYFLFFVGLIGHYVWLNVNSAGTDPAIAGYTGHEVDLATGATANAVATAIEAVMDAISGITSAPTLNVINWTHDTVGYVQPGRDGNTGFTFAVTTEGDAEEDVGLVSGDIEVALDVSYQDVTAHEFGTNVLSQISNGKSVEVSLTLEETTKTQLRKMMSKAGSTMTPAGVSGTEVISMGFDKDFVQTLTFAKKLTLHPKVLGLTDKSRDMVFWKGFPMIEGLTFSGENIFNLPVKFKIYPDTTKNVKAVYYVYGDGSQTLT